MTTRVGLSCTCISDAPYFTTFNHDNTVCECLTNYYPIQAYSAGESLENTLICKLFCPTFAIYEV